MYQDEDYVTGEEFARDPLFEEKFIRLARELKRSRRLVLARDQNPEQYFALTPENQRKFYGVTPTEFMRRAIRRGELTR